MRFNHWRFIAAFILGVIPVSICSADWRQFRGDDSSGVAADADLPTDWVDGESPKNIAWKIALPGRGL